MRLAIKRNKMVNVAASFDQALGRRRKERERDVKTIGIVN
jgi:hypothetical protein